MAGWGWGLRGRTHTHACARTPPLEGRVAQSCQGSVPAGGEIRAQPGKRHRIWRGERDQTVFAGLLWEESVYALRLEFSSFFLLFSFLF